MRSTAATSAGSRGPSPTGRRMKATRNLPGARSVAELALATPDLDPAARQLAAAMVRVPVPRQRPRSRLLLRWRRS